MTIMSNNNNNNVGGGQFGDTTLTKVFVGGLAWETPKEALREHFDKYGEILEAVIISDKLTGRSKGYGFVTFKEAEAAKRACEDAVPIINGRRANCNLASLGARRPRSAASNANNVAAAPPPNIPPQQGSKVGPRSMSPVPVPTNHHMQWYYPTGAGAAAAAVAAHVSPYHHVQHHPHHAVPYYGFSPSPTYIATDISYNHKLSYTGGTYMGGQFSQVYPGQTVVGPNAVMPMYPLYHYHQSHTMGLPAHIFPSSVSGPITTGPPLISKPPSIAPNPGTVGTDESF